MSQLFYGSICLTDIVEQAKKGHSAFTKADNGKVYANVNVWLNDEVDKYGNIMSCQLNPKKEKKEQDGTPYVGNMKQSEQKPITKNDVEKIAEEISDLPF